MASSHQLSRSFCTCDAETTPQRGEALQPGPRDWTPPPPQAGLGGAGHSLSHPFSSPRLLQGIASRRTCPQTSSLKVGTNTGSFPAQLARPSSPALLDQWLPYLQHFIPLTHDSPPFSLHLWWTPPPLPCLPANTIHQQHLKLCHNPSKLLNPLFSLVPLQLPLHRGTQWDTGKLYM